MDSEAFRLEIVERINAEYENNADRRESFISEIANGLCEFDQCDGFSPCRFDGTGPGNRKMEIDGYYFDEENKIDGTLSVFCCKYAGAETADVLTKTEIEKIYNRAKLFITSSFDGTIAKYIETDTPEFFAAKMIHDRRNDFQRFRIYIVTDDVLSDRANKSLDIEFIDGKYTQIAVWDSERYYTETVSKRNNQDVDVVLENYGFEKGIHCIKANEISEGADYDAYLCVMPGKLLADIYAKYGSQLLESNVRSFLSFRGKVNRGIRDTIRSEPARFFAYNNGISATATNVELKNTPEGLKILRMESLQIVNGGQTTASIYSATVGKTTYSLSDVYVPMKLCVIPPDAPDDLTRYISEYSNSQNKVNKSDFFSNSPFHVKIEKISRRLNAPAVQGSVYTTKWYYERARGSYAQETLGKSQAEIKAFQRENPPEQKITKTDFARYRNTLERRPYDVSKAPEANFVRFGQEANKLWESTEIKGSSVNDRYFKETVAVAIIYKAFSKMLSKKDVAPWMMSGEGKCLTSYSISKLILMLGVKGYTLNLDVIWMEQRAPDELLNQLLDIAFEIRSALQKEIEGTSRNLFDYCKSKDAWDKIVPLRIEFGHDINRWVISKGRVKTKTAMARRNESNTARMNTRIWVVSQSEEFWRRVMEWGMNNRKLNGDEISVLRTAANMNSNGKPPSERQCDWIKRIYDMLTDEGMEL